HTRFSRDWSSDVCSSDLKRGHTQLDQGGHFAQDALARGNRYGFVSFSDHGSTHNSWAAVWATTEDRAGLFDAMAARRTYAASDRSEERRVGKEWSCVWSG